MLGAQHIILTIKSEAAKRQRAGESDAFELRIHFGNAFLIGALVDHNNTFLTIKREDGLTYIIWEHIIAIEPVWI